MPCEKIQKLNIYMDSMTRPLPWQDYQVIQEDKLLNLHLLCFLPLKLCQKVRPQNVLPHPLQVSQTLHTGWIDLNFMFYVWTSREQISSAQIKSN